MTTTPMTTTPMTHFSLKAERTGEHITLTQRNAQGEPNEVKLHPHQLRELCEHFGLLTADPQAAKTIATLQRRMLALRGRIDELGDYMAKYSDADQAYEIDTIHLLAELADEWCADFAEPEGTTPTSGERPLNGSRTVVAQPFQLGGNTAPGMTATTAQAPML